MQWNLKSINLNKNAKLAITHEKHSNYLLTCKPERAHAMDLKDIRYTTPCNKLKKMLKLQTYLSSKL